MSGQLYSLLGQTEGEKKSFFRGCKKALWDMEFYDKFVDRFQVLSKVKNPAVIKAKV